MARPKTVLTQCQKCNKEMWVYESRKDGAICFDCFKEYETEKSKKIRAYMSKLLKYFSR